MANIYIGISGWRYPPWGGVFYPPKLTQARELEFASRAVRSIEINGSFYSLQRPESYAAWYDATPPNFIFSVKGNRYLTHNSRRVFGTRLTRWNISLACCHAIQSKPWCWRESVIPG